MGLNEGMDWVANIISSGNWNKIGCLLIGLDV